jgi:hypothetical protein
MLKLIWWPVISPPAHAANDYKSEDVGKALRQHCPNGIDVNFDNVRGDILDAALANLARLARIVRCGDLAVQQPRRRSRARANYLSLLVNRASMTGMVVLDYSGRFPEAVLAAGKLNSREDIATGFATFPETLLKLFAGESFGKLVLTSPTPETGLSDCLGGHSLSMVSALRHRVFGSLHRASLDDLPRWLRLEYCRLFCEWIDALARLRGGLLDDNEFGESGHNEGSRFLEFLVANFRERLDDPFDVLPAHGLRILLSDFLNKLRLRHQFVGHVFSVISNHPVTTLA